MWVTIVCQYDTSAPFQNELYQTSLTQKVDRARQNPLHWWVLGGVITQFSPTKLEHEQELSRMSPPGDYVYYRSTASVRAHCWWSTGLDPLTTVHRYRDTSMRCVQYLTADKHWQHSSKFLSALPEQNACWCWGYSCFNARLEGTNTKCCFFGSTHPVVLKDPWGRRLDRLKSQGLWPVMSEDHDPEFTTAQPGWWYKNLLFHHHS